MNKIVKLTVTTMAILTLGGTATTTASAATWHKGTPKALRGNWKRSYSDHGTKVTMHFKIKTKSIRFSRPDWVETSWTGLKYQKMSAGTYKLKGNYHNGSLTEKGAQLKVVKKHGKVTYKNSWSSSYSYLGWFHK